MTFIEKSCEYCGKLFQAALKFHNRGEAKYCSRECSQQAQKKILPEKTCSQCGKLFQSNRQFCSQVCANTFVSRQDREIKNEKISKALSIFRTTIDLVCVNCNIIFTVPVQQKRRKSCSEECEKELHRTVEARKNISLAAIKRVGSDTNTDRLKSITCFYPYNNKLIRCDSKAEYSCLNYVETHYDVADISRCLSFLEYELDGIIRRYNPDFQVVLANGKTLIVECKTPLSNKDLKRKWSIYYSSIIPKKKVLEEYCREHEYEVLFFNKDMNNSYYNSISRQQLQSVVSPEVKAPL
jgi:predicted nucleic acid-binding Zn ribbon protein